MADGDSGRDSAYVRILPNSESKREIVDVPAVAPACDGVPIWNLLTWRCEFQDNTRARTSWGSCITRSNLDSKELDPEEL